MKLATIVFFLALAGCGGDRGSFREENAEFANGLVIYTDPLNGCQYLRPIGRDALTPRLKPEGTQVCGAIAKARP